MKSSFKQPYIEVSYAIITNLDYFSYSLVTNKCVLHAQVHWRLYLQLPIAIPKIRATAIRDRTHTRTLLIRVELSFDTGGQTRTAYGGTLTTQPSPQEPKASTYHFAF